MKLTSYRLLFRIFSFLSDKTNGASFFVRYKLLLGTLIIGIVSSYSCKSSDKKQITCYDISIEPVQEEITCYLPAPIGDGIELKLPTDTVEVSGSEEATVIQQPVKD